MAIGLIDFGGGGAGGIRSPADLIEIFDEFDAAGVDHYVDFVVHVQEAAVDAIDAVADGRVGFGGARSDVIAAAEKAHVLTNDLPIGIDGGGATLAAASVAIDGDV